MKLRKKIISDLHKLYQSDVPDVFSKVDFERIELEPALPETISTTHFLEKRIFRLILTTSLVVLLLLFSINQSPSENNVFASPSDIYAFQAVSTTDLLVQALNASTYPIEYSDSFSPKVGEEISTLNMYLNMLEQFITSDGEIKATIDASTDSNYQSILTYSTYDLTSKLVTYQVFYNEYYDDTLSSFNPLFTDSLDSSLIYGIKGEIQASSNISIEGKKFNVDGNTTYILYSYVDALNYVSVAYMNDTDHVEKFFYCVIKDGIIQNTSKITITSIDQSIVTEIDFTDGEHFGNYRLSRVTTDSSTYIDVTYSINEHDDETETGSIRVDVTTNINTGLVQFTYTVLVYGHSEEIYYTRDREDFEDEDEEDEEEQQHDTDHEDDSHDEDEEDDEL